MQVSITDVSASPDVKKEEGKKQGFLFAFCLFFFFNFSATVRRDGRRMIASSTGPADGKRHKVNRQRPDDEDDDDRKNALVDE